MDHPSPDIVPLQSTFGTLAKEFGVRPAAGADVAGRDPRLQLGHALERLYTALNDLHRGDPLPLRQVWSQADDATLATPADGLLTGWDAVRAACDRDARDRHGWQVVAEDVRISMCVDAAWALCTERSTRLEPTGQTAEVRQQSTNIFRRESGAWRLVHRHVNAAYTPAPMVGLPTGEIGLHA
jgi:ketosteroid isomerase-like protein